MTLNEYCKTYRVRIGLTLQDVAGDAPVTTLHSYERGFSASQRHFMKYLTIANERGDHDFVEGLKGITK